SRRWQRTFMDLILEQRHAVRTGVREVDDLRGIRFSGRLSEALQRAFLDELGRVAIAPASGPREVEIIRLLARRFEEPVSRGERTRYHLLQAMVGSLANRVVGEGRDTPAEEGR